MKIISVPFSGGGLGHGNGSDQAPKKIIEALEEYFANEDGNTPRFSFEEVEVSEDNIEESHRKIQEHISKIKEKAIILGGDHSITHPCVKGFAKNNKDPMFIVFDAHPDLMDDFTPPTQEDYLKVLIEEGIIRPENVILIGVRNWDEQEIRYLKEKKIRHYTSKEIFEKGIKKVMEEVKQMIQDLSKDIYLSIDIDVVDPVEAIGTGYIEHGGLSSRELIYSVQKLKETDRIRMADVVEVNLKKDINDMTSKLAAKIVTELSNL